MVFERYGRPAEVREVADPEPAERGVVVRAGVLRPGLPATSTIAPDAAPPALAAMGGAGAGAGVTVIEPWG